MLVMKIASNIFLITVYVCALPILRPPLFHQQDIFYVQVRVKRNYETFTLEPLGSGQHWDLKAVYIIMLIFPDWFIFFQKSA